MRSARGSIRSSAGWVAAAEAAGLTVLCLAAGAAAAVHQLPESKRSYEVLLPTGDPAAAAGAPLAVYLHPNGEPRLADFKKDYGPLLRQRKCVLALPKASSELLWRGGDAQYVVEVLADVERRYRTHAGKVLLMGCSGGGQTALFLADRMPARFRAVILISTNPVVVRRRRHEWFYPDVRTAKTCPYLVINHITQGAALQYWRQVRAKRAPAGASLSILPVVGAVGHYQPPPKELGGWLDAVLAGKHPAPIPDPQRAAVAKMLAKCTAALPKAIATTRPAAGAQRLIKRDKHFRLIAPLPAGFERSKKEQETDAAGKPLTEVRVEHAKWPIHLRYDARRTEQPMAEAIAAEQRQTRLRGMLYQLYHTQDLTAGGRTWHLRIGSITYPDRRRGWVSALFLHAAATIAADPKQWLEVMVLDETQQPDAGELAGLLRTAIAGVRAVPLPPARRRAP